jgi:hypothetical protein
MNLIKPNEWKGFKDVAHPQLKESIKIWTDSLQQYGIYAYISPNPEALFRPGVGKSSHYPDEEGLFRAADIMLCYGSGDNLIQDDVVLAYILARKAGFKGIGFYPEWNPNTGFHVDAREKQNIATWSKINGSYVGINKAVNI